MPPLIDYADFQAATRDVKLTPRDVLLTEATKEGDTYLFQLMFEGRDVAKMFKGGTELVDKIQGQGSGNFGFYNPNQPITPSQRDTLVTVKYPWAFAQSHYVHTEETTGLNAGDPNSYIDLKGSYELACAVDTVNGIEEQLVATPNFDLMESTSLSDPDARTPMSIMAFVTRDGEVPSASNGGIASGSSAWTTIGQINPTNNAWFKNKFKTYDANNVTDLSVGLIRALDSGMRKVKFPMPNALSKWSDPANKNQRRNVIITNEDGGNIFDTVIRSVNDRMAQFNDPGVNGAQFKGTPVTYIGELDNAGWTEGSPDYLVLNLNHLWPFFRTGWFLKSKDKDGGVTLPNTTVTYKFSHYNLSCRSRRRQLRISAA